MFKLSKERLIEIGAIVAFVFFWYVVIMPVFIRWRAKNAPPASEPVHEEAADPQRAPAPQEGRNARKPGPREEEEPESCERFSAGTEEFDFQFCSVGASIERGWLRKYHLRPGDEAPLPVFDVLSRSQAGPARSFVVRNFPLADLERRNWSHRPPQGGVVEFATKVAGVEVEKRFFLPRDGSTFDIELTFRNASKERVSELSFDLWGPAGIAPDESPELPSRFLNIEAILLARESPGAKVNKKAVNALKARKLFSSAVQEAIEARQEELQRKLSDEEKKAAGERVRAEGFFFLSKELIEWAAVRNRYFGCFLLPERSARAIKALADHLPPNAVDSERSPHLARDNVTCGLRVMKFDLNPEEEKHFRFRVYLGPMRESALAEYAKDEGGNDRSLRSAIAYGRMWPFSSFDWLARLLLYVLNFFHFFTKHLGSIIGGYGLAIILLTFLVRGGMHPLQKRMFLVQQKMAHLAPEIERIKARHKKSDAGDSQRKMQAEIFELYKREGANPLSGCWVMLVQLPMFVALFGALRSAFELRQAHYLWISDLSLPDHFLGITLPLPNVWPLGGPKPLNILPFLQMGLFILQQKLAPRPADPQQQQQRTMMMYMMPVFFLFLFYSMPSGLVLYFVFSSLVGMLEQWYTRRTFQLAEVSPAKEAPDPVKTAWDKEAKHQKKQIDRAKKRKERKKNKLFPT